LGERMLGEIEAVALGRSAAAARRGKGNNGLPAPAS